MSGARTQVFGRRRVPVRPGEADGARAATPLVAVLCASSRARACGPAVALALAGTTGAGTALAGVVGDPRTATPGTGTPAARRVAARVRERGVPAAPVGRLVWIPDRRDGTDPRRVPGAAGAIDARDRAGEAAAACAELARAVAAAHVPAAIALPLTRTDVLDRVLAWHDAIVVVPEPGAPAALVDRVLAGLVALGRPVVAMAPPSRVGAALAAAGLRAPAEAVQAVAQLGLVRGGEGSGRG